MRLNVGSGTDSTPFGEKGWTNLDIRDIEGVDIVCDMTEGIPLDDDSVDEILAKDILEHFPMSETSFILNEWCRVLKIDGKIKIEVPNMMLNFQQFMTGTMKKLRPDQQLMERFSQIVFGKQDYPYNFHYQMFDEMRLGHVLREAGFKVKNFYERGRALGVNAWKI